MRRLFAFFVFVSVLFVSVEPDMYAGRRNKDPKYIFLFIGDGMGMTHVAAAESYLSFRNGDSQGLTMCGFPYFGLCSNASADADITDSSAAATAIACGAKTNNGFLGVDPNGEPLRSMTYDLQERGYQIGILSNVPVNHATPASFYASSRARSDYYNISQQIASTGFDFFAGSGFLNVTGRKKDKEPIDKEQVEYMADAVLEAVTPFAPKPVLVIPGAQTKIVIVYTIDGHEHTYTHTLSGDWKMGYKYTYNYTINVNEIIFDCTVEDWIPVEGGNITI